MNSKEKTLHAIRYLVSKSLDEQITPEEAGFLDQLILSDPQARRYYAEFIQIHACLRRLYEEALVQQLEDGNSVLDIRLWEELAHYEMIAEPVEETVRENPKADLKPLRPVLQVQRKKPSKFSLYGLAASIAAALLLILYVHIMPAPKKAVATLTDCMNCRWEEKGSELKKGDDVLNESQTLLSGFVALKFDDGAEVLVEGPAEFTPLSAEKMLLHRGKVYAHVPNKSIGFTIDTPDSSVVDLGTDFGVEILSDGSNEIHVFEGKVNLIAGSNTQSKASEIVTHRQARKIEVGSATIEAAEFKEYQFAQKISSKENRVVYGRPVSLASFVAGGDGRTPGDQPSGIDPATGRIHPTVQEELGRTGSGTYSPVAQRTVVDGVFVPNGPCVVSSAGHTFEGFPVTAGTFWSDITASPVFNYTATNEDGEILYRQQFIATLDSTSDVNMESEKPVILMHTNSGITFDLNKIRYIFKNAEIVGFRADCGVTKNAMVKMRHDFWVLLDGQQVFHYSQAANDDTAQTIDIPIREDHSFLTLATTDGGDNTSYDWCIFENAVLELAPKGFQ